MNKVTLDAGRVSLTTDAAKKFGDPREEIRVWLFLVDPGHLRVMADQTIQAVWGIDPNVQDMMDLVTREERQRLAALRMRLFATSIKPTRRLVIPADALNACEEHEARDHVWIDYSAGFVDVYTISYRKTLLMLPPEKLFPKTKEPE